MVKEISPGLIDCGWVSSEVLILEKDGEKTNKTGWVSIGILSRPDPLAIVSGELSWRGARKSLRRGERFVAADNCDLPRKVSG